MKILILGGTGMLGHRLFLNLRQSHDVWVTTRFDNTLPNIPEFSADRVLTWNNARNIEKMGETISKLHPAVVINCIGVVKQSQEAKDAESSIYVNSLFPHQLARVCRWSGVRMIHISTDCVFSGDYGNYVESDLTDATDLYGKTKSLGEVTDYNCITIRTSFIGSEIRKLKLGLFEWFMAQRGDIDGYINSWFSGMTTDELANVIDKHILPNPDMSGLWHVTGKAISKYSLLVKLKEILSRDNININPAQLPDCNRILDSTKFQRVTGYVPKSWDEMISEMK